MRTSNYLIYLAYRSMILSLCKNRWPFLRETVHRCSIGTIYTVIFCVRSTICMLVKLHIGSKIHEDRIHRILMMLCWNGHFVDVHQSVEDLRRQKWICQLLKYSTKIWRTQSSTSSTTFAAGSIDDLFSRSDLQIEVKRWTLCLPPTAEIVKATHDPG
jgi:hypothetical protein